jgi:thiamine-phosphate pyrophosphorylase
MPLTLCLVTKPDYQSIENYLHFLKTVVNAGVTMVQLRDKITPFASLLPVAQQMKALLNACNVPLLINDNVALAKAMDADGVHLGQSDSNPFTARELLKPDAIIGYSIESFADLDKANRMDCIDYVAASAVFASKSKADLKTLWGLEGLNALVSQAKHPVMAIGGITAGNAKEVMQQGGCGVAVISALHEAVNPFLATQKLRKAIEEGRQRV